MRPRLIATDLDGTFLSPDETVSETNRAAVLAAQRAGVPVVFVTGRPIRWLHVVADLPGAHPIVIASNGAMLYDQGADDVIDQVCIDAEVALTAVRAIRAEVPEVSFAFESGRRFGHEPAYETVPSDRDGRDPAVFVGSLEEIGRGDDCVKVLVQSLTAHPDTLLEQVRTIIGDSLVATHAQAGSFGLVELSAPGVNKATMLRRLSERLGVEPAEVAAFGDMPNDLDMLNWVGLPHVVANAHPALLALELPVVPSNTDSGVGRTILELLEAGAASG